MDLGIVKNQVDPLTGVAVQDHLQKLLKSLRGRFGVLFYNHVTGRGSDRSHENTGRVAAGSVLIVFLLPAWRPGGSNGLIVANVRFLFKEQEIIGRQFFLIPARRLQRLVA